MSNYHPLVLKRRNRSIHRSLLHQRDLALRLGIVPSKMGRYERGEQIPDYEDAKKIADYYDMPWSDVIELCVKFQERQNELLNFFCKEMSEQFDHSHVCTRQDAEKCGAR